MDSSLSDIEGTLSPERLGAGLQYWCIGMLDQLCQYYGRPAEERWLLQIRQELLKSLIDHSQRLYEPKSPQAVAYHESAHAVVGYCLDVPILEVSIIPEADSFGHCGLGDLGTGMASYALEKQFMVGFAGELTSALVTGQVVQVDTSPDCEAIFDMAERLHTGPAERYRYLAGLLWRTENILENGANWAAVEALTKKLIEDEYCPGKWATEIIEKAIRKAQREAKRTAKRRGPKPKS
ncbi:MAG: hypothetical protein Q7O66_23685 [Dehalococcoidia bacterium]|nr:hypothetical protein [Dehalococcoidia bacterium]